MQVCVSLLCFEPEPIAVQSCEYITAFYIVAFLDQDVSHLATNLCNYSCIGECFYWRGARIDSENVAAGRRSDFHGNRRSFILIGIRVVGARLAGNQKKSCYCQARPEVTCRHLDLP